MLRVIMIIAVMWVVIIIGSAIWDAIDYWAMTRGITRAQRVREERFQALAKREQPWLEEHLARRRQSWIEEHQDIRRSRLLDAIVRDSANDSDSDSDDGDSD